MERTGPKTVVSSTVVQFHRWLRNCHWHSPIPAHHVSRVTILPRVTRLTVPRPAAHVDHVVGVEHAELLLTLRQALDPDTAIYSVNRKKHCPGYANVRKNITSSVPLRFS